MTASTSFSAGEVWRQLKLEAFWETRLGQGREEVSRANVLELLGAIRLVSAVAATQVTPTQRSDFAQKVLDCEC